jgi:hypothetical protein
MLARTLLEDWSMAEYIVLVCGAFVTLAVVILVRIGTPFESVLIGATFLYAGIIIFAASKMRKERQRTKMVDDRFQRLYNFEHSFLDFSS